MYEKETEQLQKIIDDSSRIVFLAAQECRRRVIFRTSAVRMEFIIRSISILRSRW